VPNAVQDIFKAYDVRGKVGTELTADVARSIGKAFADWLPIEGTVAVGRDMRPDSAELATALIKGLREQGRNVWDIGEVTSDMIYFAVGHFKLAGGAVVTASHNPGQYNGIKLCADEAKAVGQDSGLFDIRDNVLTGTFKPAANTSGTLETKDVGEDWITHVLSFIDPTKLTDLRIAVDAGNGMAGKTFPELEPYVPWQVTEMYFKLDGTFPNHEANPLKFETLAELIKTIKSEKLDGGIAFDGDGDRAFLIDETGTVLTGGVMSAMLAEYFLTKHPGSSIIYDARNSRSVPKTIEKHGGKSVRTKVGHSNLKLVMREEDAPFGGEASGHFYFRDNWYADSGLIAAVIGLYVATLSGKKLSQLREQYTHYATIPETNFVVEDKESAIAAVEALFPDAKFDTLDGLTVNLPNHAWINIRASNTEPVLRLNAEATSQQELNVIVDKVKTVFQS
jgi:phosphomannomutase